MDLVKEVVTIFENGVTVDFVQHCWVYEQNLGYGIVSKVENYEIDVVVFVHVDCISLD